MPRNNSRGGWEVGGVGWGGEREKHQLHKYVVDFIHLALSFFFILAFVIIYGCVD